MKSPFSEEETTARLTSQRESIQESSSESTTGIRSFYFDNEQKGMGDENVASMEYTTFHLDLNSSRSSSPEEIDCLTYNIAKNDSEFHKRIDQIKKEAFNNWLEGKLNLKKKREAEKFVSEKKMQEISEQEKHKLAVAREQKLIEWFNRKKQEKQLKQMESNKLDNENVARKQTTFLVETAADQTKMNFEAWKLKKMEKERVEREKKEKRQKMLMKFREAEKSLSMEKHIMWLRTAHEKPKPVPLNQGLLSLRGSLYPIYCNPQPWISNV